MANVHRLPSPAQAKREASEWIARLDTGDASDEDRAEFERWRRANALNARAFDELSATYRQFVAAGPLVRAVSYAQSMNDAAMRPSRLGYRTIAAAVAGFVLLACLATMFFLHTGPLTYRTAVGEHATIALPDGSVLELNSASAARVQYESARRLIWLQQGEAYFRVVHDANRAFWVKAGSSWVRAVGTAFNVYLRAHTIEVTVSEGAVKVGPSNSGFAPPDEQSSDTAATVVRAGQQAEVVGAATATRPLSSLQLARTVAWREGTLYFEDQPLEEVSAELERYSAIKFELADATVRNLRVGGTFQASPQGAETLVTMLERGFGLKVTREADRVHIENRPAPGGR